MLDNSHSIRINGRCHNLKTYFQIVDDALNLARGELLSYTQALNTIQYLKNETEYVPWYAALANFKFILTRFKSEERAIFEVGSTASVVVQEKH